MKIYVPSEITYTACYTIYDKDTLRVYQNTPTYNSSVNYYDIYFNSHYYYRQGQQTWTQYSTLPQCINSDNITTDVYYRNDFDSIIIITFILLLICFYFPFKIISRLFGRWFKW